MQVPCLDMLNHSALTERIGVDVQIVGADRINIVAIRDLAAAEEVDPVPHRSTDGAVRAGAVRCGFVGSAGGAASAVGPHGARAWLCRRYRC